MANAANKYVYFFGQGKADGKSEMRALLGGKGANLAEMTNIGLPVPSGFTITTEVCNYYYANGRQYPPELKDQVLQSLSRVEEVMGAKFGSTTNPLLVSCRSVLPGVRFACDAYVTFVREASLLEAVASSLTEFFAPDLMSKRVLAWEKHYVW